MMPLSSPVLFHCWTNSFCDRLAIIEVIHMEIGMVTRAMSASDQEIENISATTAMTVSSEVSSWLSVWLRLCWMLSTSLVTRLSSSPRGWPSK